MKKSIFVVLTALFLLAAMAGFAFADRYDSGYQDPSAGVSPHGGYLTTTNYCAVCHAVHNPGGLSGASSTNLADQAWRTANLGGSQVLLRSSIADACEYCHVNAGNRFDIKMVYAGDPTLYDGTTGTPANGHTAATGGDISDTNVKCVDCHQVHGATQQMATADEYMTAKILKFSSTAADPGFTAGGGIQANTDPGTGLVADETNLSGYCSQCHMYYNTAYNGDSHTMQAAYDDYQNPNASASVRGGSVAFAASGTCRACHQRGTKDVAGGAGNTGANNYPHYTDSYRFLAAGANVQNADASTGSTDGNCLVCHASDDGVTQAGAGISF